MKFFRRFTATALSCLALSVVGLFVQADDRVPATVAERSEFHVTARHDELKSYLELLTERSDHVRHMEFGSTVEGRSIPAVIVSRPVVTSAVEAKNCGKLIVLMLGNIHAGECDGKEALLALARDLALNPDDPILQHLVLVVVPNFNADGNERMAANNRPGQVGPELTGRRENAQGLDLNRDFVKLETPEVQALVRFMNDWDPHVFIDCHTTNGSRHRYALTFASPHNLAAAEAPRRFTNDVMLPAVMRRLEANGTDAFFYGNFDREHTRWTSYGHEPRYGIEYVGLRGRIAILAESYSYRPYKERIEATSAFVRECLSYLAEHRHEVMATLDAAAKQTVDASSKPDPTGRVPIRAKLVARADQAKVKGFEVRPNRAATPQANGSANRPAASDKPKDHVVELVDRCEPTLEVMRPFAYTIPSDQSRIADKLRQHGIAIERLVEPVSCEVELIRAEKIDTTAAPFNRHRLRTATVAMRRERRDLPTGSVVVRTAQPLGNLAVYLLEPASDDGFATWNFFDHVARAGADYPVMRLPMAVKLATQPVQQVEPNQALTLDQIYGPENKIDFSGTPAVPPRWLPGGPEYLERSGNRLMRTNAETSETRPFHDAAKMEKAFAALDGIKASDARTIANPNSFSLNSDASATLVTHANDLFHYRFTDGRATRLTKTPEREEHASFSPDGKRVAFVRDHNLFVVDVETGEERAMSQGGNEQMRFGELDWVYQEEIYGRGNFKAYWWSPDSTRLALLRLDESEVKPFTVVDHLPVRQELEITSYPKAGDPNPKVKLGVVSVVDGTGKTMDISEYESVQPLIVRVGWTPDSSRVVYQVQNREQTWLDLRTADPETGTGEKLFRETSPAWVEVLGEPRWLKNGSFVWQSNRSGSRHIYRASADGQDVVALTSGSWDVQELDGVDEENGWAYFTATKDSAAATHVYRVRLDGTELERLTERRGTHSASFDDSFRYFIDTVSDVHTPPQTWLHRTDGERVRAIEPNAVDHLRHYRLNRPEFLQVKARDGFVLEAMLIKPPDFDPTKKYPVLCYQYSGPQAPVVRDRWGGPTYLWHQMLAQKGYVIWSCDTRSASTKGISAAFPIHRKMGQHELEDIEDGLAWLKSQPWIDPDRIGIWGWSYGGYMTSYALTHSRSFKIGIAGAPVTDWHNYDTIYTERYMGLPSNNPDGYKSSSVLTAAANLHGRLLLLHGTTDDNVHLTNTLQFAHALQMAGKQFDLMLYPKSRHGVTDPLQVRHMRELMTRFVLNNL
jgi:dipeptidyl aminopeptidase/acylaminoacyl peptidase